MPKTQTMSFDYFIYLLKNPFDWDGNDVNNQRQSILVPYLLPELIDIVFDYFPTIRWTCKENEKRNEITIQLSRSILSFFQGHNMFVRPFLKCGGVLPICAYCGFCKCCDLIYHDETDSIHTVGQFIHQLKKDTLETNELNAFDFGYRIQFKDDIFTLNPYPV